MIVEMLKPSGLILVITLCLTEVSVDYARANEDLHDLMRVGASFENEFMRKGAKPKFFNLFLSRPTVSLKPQKLIVFNSERYDNWSDWSECLPRDCIQLRYRKCLDNSWEQPIGNRIHTTKCVSKYYAEKRTCLEKTGCNSEIGAQLIQNLSETCGVRLNERISKITGGSVAVPHSWPWAVRLSVKPPRRQLVTFCGGTLIAPNWILTAAHCLLVENKRIPVGRLINLSDHMRSSLYVHIGDHHKNRKEENQQDFRVTKAILHPKYHRKLMTDGYDIALLYLPQLLPQVPTINFACLPTKDLQLKPGTGCYAVGWGDSKPKPEPTFDGFPDYLFPSLFGPQIWYDSRFRHRDRAVSKDLSTHELHEVAIPVVPIDQCNKFYSDLNDEVHICAGTKGKDTCSGDSGGGLYCKNPETDQWFITGITSFGLAKGCGRHPGVYTSVSAHLDWISNKIAEPVV